MSLTDEQKSFLQGFAMGSDVARAVRSLPILSNSAAQTGACVKIGPTGVQTRIPAYPGADPMLIAAQDRFLIEGKSLTREEQAKRAKDPFSMHDERLANASAGVFPKDTDVFLYKYSGLFHVAPTQNAFMCRLRLPGGFLRSWQFRGVCEIARRYGGGYADVTTRANLQIREIGPTDAPRVLEDLVDLGIVTRGSGADNIRNVTASPLSGIDPEELIETYPLAKSMHHHILNCRELYGLPRKFNIAFEGGGRISSLDDTNDVGFRAVRVVESSDSEVPLGVYFRLCLGGITGHLDFARDTGVLLRPDECVAVASAVVRVFLKEGDRTDRKKARLKYLLDSWGLDRFLGAVEKEWGRSLRRFPLERCESSQSENRWAHVGVHPQKQVGKSYLGVVLPVGRLTSEQMNGLAAIAERFGSGTIRLTVWQNVIISDIDDDNVDEACQAIRALGLDHEASTPRAGLVACTGSAGCKFAGANTKANAMELAAYLESRLALDRPVNIHLTGCHHSCAQHYIGDIGLEATKVEVGDDLVDGYHLCVGGGWGSEQGIGRRIVENLPFAEILPAVERLLRHYLTHRQANSESFSAFSRRQTIDLLRSVAIPPVDVAPFEVEFNPQSISASEDAWTHL